MSEQVTPPSTGSAGEKVPDPKKVFYTPSIVSGESVPPGRRPTFTLSQIQYSARQMGYEYREDNGLPVVVHKREEGDQREMFFNEDGRIFRQISLLDRSGRTSETTYTYDSQGRCTMYDQKWATSEGKQLRRAFRYSYPGDSEEDDGNFSCERLNEDGSCTQITKDGERLKGKVKEGKEPRT